MNNLPIKQRKLSILKKIKLKFYQLREYDRKWFEQAPEYIKQDEKIIRKMIKTIIPRRNISIFRFEMGVIIEVFKSNPELFDKEQRNMLIKHIKISSEDVIAPIKFMECIAYLSKEEFEEICDEKDKFWLYPYISLEQARYLINTNSFNTTFFRDCALDVQVEVMKENKELIYNGSLEAQSKYLEDNLSDFNLASDNGKIKFLSENPQYLVQYPEYVKRLPKEIQIVFATKDKNNIRFLSENYQKEIIDNHPNAFTYITEEMKQKIFNNKEDILLIKKIINSNFKNTKYLLGNYDNYNNYYLKNIDVCNEYFKNISEEISNYKLEQLENIFLKSGIIFARGTLRNYGYGYQDNGSDPREKTIDIYSNEELQLIQRLLPEQISKLIKIDSNYILGYVGNANTQKRYGKRIDIESEENYKYKCKEVFKSLYGDDKLNLYERCIDNIYKAAVKFEDRDNKNRKNIKDRQTQFPLESLKLLFNEKILNNNDTDTINEYYNKLLDGEDVKELFSVIIGNAYGEKAIQILNEREDLDIYNINSLEIFDERILNNFSLPFVNDLLSYNIVGISSFFNIVKNENDLKIFKQYYNLLSKIFGENIETMQKAISEYYYIDDLLKNIDIDKLNESQYNNLISCICGNRNEFGISSIDELNQFDAIANQQFINEEEYKVWDYRERKLLKQKIFSNFFGLNTVREFELIDELTEEEKDIINCVNFINNESSGERLQDVIKELIKNKNIRNPIALHTAINKIKDKTRMKPLKEKLLLKEDLDKACENLDNKGKIRKEKCDNINIYYLTGIDFSKKRVLEHSTHNSYGREIMESESQLGMSTVSTTYSSIDSRGGRYLFTDIEAEDLIGVNPQDAGTSHIPKIIRASRKCWKCIRCCKR